MNKRLAEAGVGGLGLDILERKRLSDAGLTDSGYGSGSGSGGSGNKGGHSARFEKMHEQAFEKMEGIDKHYAARRPSPEKNIIGKKRKSDAMGALGYGRKASGARVISNGARKRMGMESLVNEDGVVADEQAEFDGNGRHSKRPRFEKGRHVSIARPPNAHGTDDGQGSEEMTQEQRDKEAGRLLKEREAIKRKLEMNRKRRRSSMGRPSLGPMGLPATRKDFPPSHSRLLCKKC
jgi:hypothetical protein